MKIVGLIIFIINIFFIGFFMGVDVTITPPSFKVYGGNITQDFIYSYICISFLIGIYFLIKTMKDNILSKLFCVFILLLIYFPYNYIYTQKKHLFNAESEVSHIYSRAFLLDWISIILIIFLLIYQVIIVLRGRQSSNYETL